MAENLIKTPLVKHLAAMVITMESTARTAGLVRGSVRATVKDVDDPQNRGRVRVLLDSVNYEDVPKVEGAGDYSLSRKGSAEYLSHWIDTSPAFKGKQSKGLIGKRVNLTVSQNMLQYSILQDVLHDTELLTDDAAKKLKIPNNSTMTRLPVYDAGELPPACEENHGCSVIEAGGPMDSDWMCVCLKRDGEFYWVRHSDLSHGHAGGNDGYQQSDSTGSRQNPVMMGTVGDAAFPTTAKQFKQNSSYTEKPTGNPKGDRSHWYPPPMSTLEYKPGKDFDLLNPDPNIALAFVRDAAAFPGLNESIAGFKPKFNPKIPTILQPKAIEYLKKAQKTLALVEDAKKAVKDPLKFVTDQALSAAKGAASGISIPPGTQVAISKLQSAAGFLTTPSLSSITPSLGQVFSGLKSIASSFL